VLSAALWLGCNVTICFQPTTASTQAQSGIYHSIIPSLPTPYYCSCCILGQFSDNQEHINELHDWRKTPQWVNFRQYATFHCCFTKRVSSHIKTYTFKGKGTPRLQHWRFLEWHSGSRRFRGMHCLNTYGGVLLKVHAHSSGLLYGAIRRRRNVDGRNFNETVSGSGHYTDDATGMSEMRPAELELQYGRTEWI
jgi:hypothetical protein